ncbi:MAG: T9SS type A sorting domain-containing protein [Ignavibacteriaceae bacterium]|nr:T9SS type A sorting domain-containing protein [Ignavibacteriaceae bacterium]
MKNLILSIMIFLSYLGNTNATTYYVDYTNGHDYNSGLSEELAWQTVEKVDTASNSNSKGILNPGDQVLFKRGCRWYLSTASLLPERSGSYGSPIIYGAYGTGDLPEIDGNYTIDYCLNLNGPGGSNDSPTLTYIQIQDMKFTHGGYNVNIWDCANISIINCEMDNNYGLHSITGYSVNIYIGQGSNVTVDHCTITNTAIINNGGSGECIYLDGVDNAIVENTLIDGGRSGIRIGFGNLVGNWPLHTDNLTVCYCTVKNQSFDCIDDDGAVNSQFYYNLFESINSSTNTYHDNLYIFSPPSYTAYVPNHNSYYNNTFITHSNYHYVYTIEINTGTATANNLTFKNNLIYNDKANDDHEGLIFLNHTNPSSTWAFDNNIYFLTGLGYDYAWLPDYSSNTTPLYSFADWQSYDSYNYDANSSYQNPLFDYSNGTYSLYYNSPALLVGIGLNLPSRDILGNYVGNPPDLGAYQNSTYWQGQISGSLSMGGSVAVTGDLTLTSGTLSSQNAIIKVATGANITINGTLQASNCTFQPLGTDYWGTLTIDGVDTYQSTVNYCTLNHGSGIECKNGADISINNTTFDTCSTGIYIYNSQPSISDNTIREPLNNGICIDASGLSPDIERNTFIKTNNPLGSFLPHSGIYSYNSAIQFISYNNISGFDYGLLSSNGCWTLLNNLPANSCNNIITNNNIGIETDDYSLTCGWINPSRSSNIISSEPEFNSIHNNTLFDISTTYYSRLFSWDDYLGDTPQLNNDATSQNYIFDPLYSSPCDEQNHKCTNDNIYASNSSLSDTGSNSLLLGLLYENQGKIDNAISFYKGLIQNDIFPELALSKLASIRHKFSRPEITTYLENLITNDQVLHAKIKKQLADIYLQNNKFEQAITAYNDVINSSTACSNDWINAKFEKLFACLNVRKDFQTASTIFSELKGMSLVDSSFLMRLEIAGELINHANKLNKGKSIGKSNNNIPTEYTLFQNFPNPFNPATTIRYQIPKPGIVTLKIFDILGREVAALVNENKIEGSYDYTFNASRFPSGVYIYQLRVNDYVFSKKMLLVK